MKAEEFGFKYIISKSSQNHFLNGFALCILDITINMDLCGKSLEIKNNIAMKQQIH